MLQIKYSLCSNNLFCMLYLFIINLEADMRFKKSLMIWHFFGAIAIMSFAALWHFVYAWTPNVVAAAIFPVNESVWEYLKLFLVPSAIFYVIEFIAIGYRFRNYIFAHGMSLVAMPLVTLAMFYFYRNLAGVGESLLINVIITFISICIGLYVGYKLTIQKRKIGNSRATFIIAAVLLVLYGVLTFIPPKTPMFQDSNTGGYGIEGSVHSPGYVPKPTPSPTEENPEQDEPGATDSGTLTDTEET